MNTILVLGAVLAAFVFIAPLRRRCVTPFVFRFFKKEMPPFSETEKLALLAGKMGEEKTLLYKPNWDKIFPKSLWGKITEEEEKYLNGPVETLCAMIDDYAISQTREIPKEVWDCIKKIRIFAMNMSKEDGGLGFSKTGQSKVISKIASRSASVSVVCMVPNSLGPVELIHFEGTAAQKARWLPRFAAGEEIPAFGLTSPKGGSDAGGMECYGIVYRGEDGKPWMCLNWEKRYITLGPVCTLLGVAFKLFDPEHILGDKENVGITLALIPINDEMRKNGVDIGRYHDPLGLTFYNGPNSGKDVRLPIEEYVIGGVGGVGKGWNMLMKCLTVGRFVSLPSLSRGAAKYICSTVGAYAGIRDQFKTVIGNFGGVEEYLGKIVGLTYLIDSVTLAGTDIADDGGQSPVLSAIAKYHTTANFKKIITLAKEIPGGKAIMRGRKNFLAGLQEAAEVAATVEGANILTRSMIIFGQGFVRCHPWLLLEMMALEIADKKTALCEFDRAFVGHVRHAVKTFFRAGFHGLGGWRFSPAPKGEKFVRRYYHQMNRMSSALGLVSEATLMVLGGKLKREERISERLGDVLSYLYQGGAILKRYRDLETGLVAERSLMEWGMRYSLYEMQNALVGVLDNFPVRWIAWILARIIFLFGKPYSPPSDALEQTLARMITEPLRARSIITEGVYIPPLDDLENENLALLEVSLYAVFEAAPIEKKIALAKKSGETAVLTEREKEVLEEARELRAKAVAVDDFEKLT